MACFASWVDLETRVLLAMANSTLSGPVPSPAKKPMDDYKVTTLQLSPGRRLYAELADFEFRPYRRPLPDDASRGQAPRGSLPPGPCVQRLVCHVDRGYRNLGLWQHYVQLAFPCWSLFQRFPRAKHYLDIDEAVFPSPSDRDGKPKAWHPWTSQLHRYFKEANVQFLGNSNKAGIAPGARPECEWIATNDLKSDGHGWGDPRGETPLHNMLYVMDQSDLTALQKVVLGGRFRASPSNGDTRAQVLLLDREDERSNHDHGGSREWVHSKAALVLIQQHWGGDIDARRLANFDGHTLEEQAAAMHAADVIISPHGAQLTNNAFIRPCTAVLELFPRRYYYPKKGPLAMEAGGIAFDGYHFDGSPFSETPQHTAPVTAYSGAFNASSKANAAEAEAKAKALRVGLLKAKALRVALREVEIHASPESILRALPNLLHAVISCRKRERLLYTLRKHNVN